MTISADRKWIMEQLSNGVVPAGAAMVAGGVVTSITLGLAHPGTLAVAAVVVVAKAVSKKRKRHNVVLDGDIWDEDQLG